MPNFTIGTPTGDGFTIEAWTDPATSDLPSRLNPNGAHPPRYFQLIQNTGPITVAATVNGVDGPLDAALAGETFTSYFAEVPVWPAPAISSPVGQSSVATFTPISQGLHLFMMRRINGGAVGVHFFVVAAE